MKPAATLVALISFLLWPHAATAEDLAGPGRFCGYSPIIDLLAGERIVTLRSGMHGGSFRWQGAFGNLEVYGVGWGSRPRGRLMQQPTSRGHAMFESPRREGKYTVALWNGDHGAAYFSSPRPLTRRQLAAIGRVDLFQEGRDPEGCDLRTMFVWQ